MKTVSTSTKSVKASMLSREDVRDVKVGLQGKNGGCNEPGGMS